MKVNLKDLIQNKLNVYLIVFYMLIYYPIYKIKNSINIVFYFFDIIIIKLM